MTDNGNAFAGVQRDIGEIIEDLETTPAMLENTSEQDDDLIEATVAAASHLAAAHRIIGDLASRWEVDQRFGRVAEARIAEDEGEGETLDDQPAGRHSDGD